MTTNKEFSDLGLYDKKSDEMIPIFSTDIKAELYGKFAKICLTHKYYNPYSDYLDTKFKFPKGLYQVFDKIEAVIDNHKIIGIVGKKKIYRSSQGRESCWRNGRNKNKFRRNFSKYNDYSYRKHSS